MQEDIFILGDVNINYLENTKSTKDLRNMEKELGLKQYIITTTRLARRSRTLIDHIPVYTYCNNEANSGTIEIAISDHFLTFITVNKPAIKYERVTFTCRNYANLNEQLLREKLGELDWTEYFKIKSPENCWEHIYEKLLRVFDEIYPEQMHVNVRKKSEWRTSDLFALMRERERKYKIARQLNTIESWQEAKNCRNLTNDACRRAKNDFV